MRSSRRVPLGIAAFVSAVGLTLGLGSACGQFSAEEPRDDGGGNVGGDGGTPDGTTTTPPNGDASSSDSGEADGQSLECNHTFCETFDSSEEWFQWQSVPNAQAQMFVETVHLVSAPRSFGVRTMPTSGVARAYLSRSFQAAKRVVLEADVKVDAAPSTTNDLDLFSLHFLKGSPTLETVMVVFRASDKNVYLEHNPESGSKVERAIQIREDGFAHVRLQVTSTNAQLAYAGTSQGIVLPKNLTLNQEWELRIGATWFNHAAGSWSAYIDNLTIDLE